MIRHVRHDQRSTRSCAVALSGSAKRTEWHRVRTDANTAESDNGEGDERGRRERTAPRGSVMLGEGVRSEAGGEYRRGGSRREGARADSAVSGRPLASLVALRTDGGGGRDDAWAATRRHSGGREGMRTTVERTVR